MMINSNEFDTRLQGDLYVSPDLIKKGQFVRLLVKRERPARKSLALSINTPGNHIHPLFYFSISRFFPDVINEPASHGKLVRYKN